jgi:hypothetical protein
MNDVKENITNKKSGSKPYLSNTGRALTVTDQSIAKLISEGGDDFFKYVRSTRLPMNSRLIVLPSLHHYYYDSDELKNVKTIVVIKKLNRIAEIESFLDTHLDFLPENCNFIGCFINNSKIERYALRTGTTKRERTRNNDRLEMGIVSRFPFLNMMYSLMDSRTNSYMSAATVTDMLSDHGFEILNMTESDGLTFFHSRKVATHIRNLN